MRASPPQTFSSFIRFINYRNNIFIITDFIRTQNWQPQGYWLFPASKLKLKCNFNLIDSITGSVVFQLLYVLMVYDCV